MNKTFIIFVAALFSLNSYSNLYPQSKDILEFIKVTKNEKENSLKFEVCDLSEGGGDCEALVPGKEYYPIDKLNNTSSNHWVMLFQKGIGSLIAGATLAFIYREFKSKPILRKALVMAKFNSKAAFNALDKKAWVVFTSVLGLTLSMTRPDKNVEVVKHLNDKVYGRRVVVSDYFRVKEILITILEDSHYQD